MGVRIPPLSLKKGNIMARIPIIDKQKNPLVPSNKDLSKTVDRFRPPGGKPPLPLDKSYNRQGGKNEEQPKAKR